MWNTLDALVVIRSVSEHYNDVTHENMLRFELICLHSIAFCRSSSVKELFGSRVDRLLISSLLVMFSVLETSLKWAFCSHRLLAFSCKQLELGGNIHFFFAPSLCWQGKCISVDMRGTANSDIDAFICEVYYCLHYCIIHFAGLTSQLRAEMVEEFLDYPTLF